MCGIAGEFHPDPRAQPALGVVEEMAARLRHRGPDGDGIRRGPGYALGHRRLAIVDPQGGAQPMHDGAGRLWVTFNGIIYNYPELRAELEAAGYRFRTSCDTEVLLHGYAAWGQALPERLVGMFAFAIVDEPRHRLFAARDRLGKKPLHYVVQDGWLAFASELKALLARPDVRPSLRPEAISQFLCLRYVPDPATVYAGIHKLPPGHCLTYDQSGLALRQYWRLSFAPASAAASAELEAEVLARLDEAVRCRLLADVPLGAFLSGGIDSYAVVDAMRRVSTRGVVACAVGFDDPRFDELPHARQAARACGAELHEAVVREQDMLEHRWFADAFDEPFADDSAIPTYHVSCMARRHVTVALAGDGGDECFAGYRRYRFDDLENRWRGLLPAGLWRLLGAAYPKADFLPRALRLKRTLQNLACDPALAYARSVSANLPEQVLPLLRGVYREAASDPLAPVLQAYRAADGPDPLSRAAAADFATYLPGDILVKVDRASMATSLEVRAPLLDHRIVELAARIPSRIKLAGHQTKGLLRRALRHRLAPAALKRRKQGFSVPLRRWMAGPLGDSLAAALRDDRLGSCLDTAAVGDRLAQHRRGVADHSALLWGVLVLDRFLGRWMR